MSHEIERNLSMNIYLVSRRLVYIKKKNTVKKPVLAVELFFKPGSMLMLYQQLLKPFWIDVYNC